MGELINKIEVWYQPHSSRDHKEYYHYYGDVRTFSDNGYPRQSNVLFESKTISDLMKQMGVMISEDNNEVWNPEADWHYWQMLYKDKYDEYEALPYVKFMRKLHDVIPRRILNHLPKMWKYYTDKGSY